MKRTFSDSAVEEIHRERRVREKGWVYSSITMWHILEMG
jgi:hypothetical protein